MTHEMMPRRNLKLPFNIFSGVYKGYPAVLIKDSSNQGLRFMIYKDLSERLNKKINNKMACDAMAGSTAAIISVMFNTPVDVIKTRM